MAGEIAQITVFGGVRVGTTGKLVAVSSPRTSVLIAALVVARGAVVPFADLRILMWPSGEPASAANQLHRLVGQARRVLEPDLSPRDAGVFIIGSSTGYRLDTRRVRSDLEDCDTIVALARRLGQDEEWDAATDEYVRALDIVRSPLLGDETWQAGGHPAFSAVAHTRTAVANEALSSARRCGRIDRVATLVEQIAAPLPFEEALQANLIRALAEAGRRREAMSVYDRVRTALVEELGVDPGPELRGAHRELLGIGTLETAGAAATTHGGSGGPPVQLPPSPRGLLTRSEVQPLLDRVARSGDAGAVLITSIGGMGGIGKTTLAVAWARSLAPRFPDGQLYLNLRGFDPTGQVVTPMDALNELLTSVGEPAATTPESLETRSARFRSAVADRKLLLLLDNARDAEQVRPLLPASPECLVIVTSRNQLATLVVREGAVPLRLDRMTNEQARDLLTRRVGVLRLGMEPLAVDRIIAAAAGLPLALAIVAARLTIDPQVSLAAVADELAGPSGSARAESGLSGWTTEAPSDDLASVFDWSYDVLDGETARVFRLLGVHPSHELSFPAIVSLSGLDRAAAQAAVSRLVAASLLERRGRDSFALHDLLREYAVSRLHDSERREAEARLVGHYVRTMRNAWNCFGRLPVGELDEVATSDGVFAETFSSPRDATDWYVRERAGVLAVLHLAIARGWDRAAANIAIDWRPMNQLVDADAYTLPHAQAALAAAERTGDALLRAELHRDVGPKASRLGDVAAGHRHLEQAREIYAQMGDRVGEANVLRNLSASPAVSADVALDHLRVAINLVHSGEAPQVLQVLRAALAARLLIAGREEDGDRDACLEAEQLLSECIPDLLENDWTYLMPGACITLSEILLILSRPGEALAAARQGRQFAENDPDDLAILHSLVAQAALETGERSAAAQACADFHRLVEDAGRDHVEEMLAGAMAEGEPDPFERILKVEADLS